MIKIKELFAHKIFRILKWVILILVGLYIILVIVRTFHYFDVQKTESQVIKIHSTKLSIDDVMGKNLPPDPGIEADKTIQGIDMNFNGIRDDVELAIFKEYPKSAKTRAVLLQYALALQMMSIQPFVNEEVATAVMQEKSRGYICVGTVLDRNEKDESVMNKYFEDSDKLRSFVEEKQLDTIDRINNDKNFYTMVRSYSDIEKDCDIDLSKLPN
ncbi:TPA: hypothetical protein DCX66_02760 [Candidatus Nomurabacteria bacterium]|uniref:Uncharacterized protein n=1 Tax=Candidatus Nomurabacteria bacterium GW2011_GWE1_35_16 TaxID=1618761 RepID=A0A0G0BR77_9BACT|nr:MAG: hypothetical protein UR55_C0013G0018 [Candidatus Nomurabacteria bacterium GW2011_GWF1_34_20]KKP62749.1 MAG: hypothetical protein UR57_C0012G0018 [Candidatus Nomurabacteria bacterium GW2011_GWE2_34_25]KKP66121.1 MAG: hypothetical protein UR64_C0012G0018 [Candidatus Nomurabacteria bacterium GW2011_GWE1_35_16]HAE36339.1 hypothetical protein [Candidatus Nomurabacteria bacterium]HAX65369.1 hypothetical protein [Candidatus Nomurabacteria bacterium]